MGRPNIAALATHTVLMLTTTQPQLQFDSNEALVRPFMDLLVTYIRVHVMMSSIPSREAAFGMYAVANRIIRGDLDPDYDQ